MKLITKDGFCPACMMTEKVLKHNGVKFTVTHLDKDKDAQEYSAVLNKGFKQYPIVEPNNKLDDASFSGFRPEKLNA